MPTICSDGHKIELTKSSGSLSAHVTLFLNSTCADLPFGNYSINDSIFVRFGRPYRFEFILFVQDPPLSFNNEIPAVARKSRDVHCRMP